MKKVLTDEEKRELLTWRVQKTGGRYNSTIELTERLKAAGLSREEFSIQSGCTVIRQITDNVIACKDKLLEQDFSVRWQRDVNNDIAQIYLIDNRLQQNEPSFNDVPARFFQNINEEVLIFKV